jgi:hypothetical protein
MKLKEVQEIVKKGKDSHTATALAGMAFNHASGFLDAIDQLKATGLREDLRTIALAKSDGFDYREDVRRLERAISIAQNALAKLDTLLGGR